MLDSIIGAAANLIGTKQTNQANIDIANQNNEWSAAQYAQRYQTTVKDLQAAGLNPMLAYSQGAGTAPTAQQTAPMQNALGAAVEGYNRGKQTSSASMLANLQAMQASSQVAVNNASAKKITADAAVSNQQAELLREETLNKQVTRPQIEASTKAYEGQATASAASAAQSYKQIEQLTQNITNLKADLQRIQQNNDQSAPESDIAKKYPTFYYIFHKLMPSISGSVGQPFRYSK